MQAGSPRAVIFVDDIDRLERAAACADYCARRGYAIFGIIVGDEQWDDALRLAVDDVVDVIVVSSRAVLPAKRRVRLESVTQEFPTVRSRRTRPLR